jgi:hypothetical protein
MSVPELSSFLHHKNTKKLLRPIPILILLAICASYPAWKQVRAYQEKIGAPLRIELSCDEGTMSLPEAKGELKLVLIVPPCGKDKWTEWRYLSTDQSKRPWVLEPRGTIAKAQLNLADGSARLYEPFSPATDTDKLKAGLKAVRFENDYNQPIEALLILRPKKAADSKSRSQPKPPKAYMLRGFFSGIP